MADVSGAAAALGIKIAGLIGGAVGSAVTLSYLPAMGVGQRIAAFATGLACAAYLPPLVAYGLHTPDALTGPMGFLAGLSGVGLVSAVINISRDPIGAWRRFRGMDTDTGTGGQS